MSNRCTGRAGPSQDRRNQETFIRGFRRAAFTVLLLALFAAKTHLAPLKPGGLIRAAHAHPAPRSRPIWIHSHNDYTQKRPLKDALQNGFRSVEADIWFDHGDLRIAHLPIGFVGTLRQLYLEPLQELVDRRGSVHGDGHPFHLWIDIKSTERALRPLLRAQLSRYPMLRGQNPMVIAILTGDERSKAAYLEEMAEPFACRDSNELHANDPPGDAAWSWYSLRWLDFFAWDGRGDMPPAERNALKALVARVHAGRRSLRFWETPDTEELWSEILDADVDMLGTDDLPRMRQFLGMLQPVAALDRR